MSKSKRREQARRRAANVRSMPAVRALLSRCSACGEKASHFVPPSFHDEGFYICSEYLSREWDENYGEMRGLARVVATRQRPDRVQRNIKAFNVLMSGFDEQSVPDLVQPTSVSESQMRVVGAIMTESETQETAHFVLPDHPIPVTGSFGEQVGEATIKRDEQGNILADMTLLDRPEFIDP